MYGKKLLNYALLALLVAVGLELVKDALQQATTQSNLDSTILDYNLLGRKRFTTKLLAVCRRDNLPQLRASDIKIYEDRDTGMVRVEVHYTRRLRLPFHTITRELTATATTRQVDL